MKELKQISGLSSEILHNMADRYQIDLSQGNIGHLVFDAIWNQSERLHKINSKSNIEELKTAILAKITCNLLALLVAKGIITNKEFDTVIVSSIADGDLLAETLETIHIGRENVNS